MFTIVNTQQRNKCTIVDMQIILLLLPYNKETHQSLPDKALHESKKIVIVSNHYVVQLASQQVVQSDTQL